MGPVGGRTQVERLGRQREPFDTANTAGVTDIPARRVYTLARRAVACQRGLPLHPVPDI